MLYMCVQRKYDASMSYRANMSILCQDRKKEVNNSLYNFL